VVIETAAGKYNTFMVLMCYAGKEAFKLRLAHGIRQPVRLFQSERRRNIGIQVVERLRTAAVQHGGDVGLGMWQIGVHILGDFGRECLN
jgi:hypothetical protein